MAHAVARLNQIETGITALADAEAGRDACSDSEREDRQFRPHLCREPEIELVFHHAHNPFSERFEQEEVIVDPLASLETLSGAAHRVAARDVESSSESSPLSTEPADAVTAQQDAGRLGFDPVLPDLADETVTSPLPRAGTTDDALPGDDRDLLEIFADRPEVPDDYALALAAHRPRRREYRQLFASLRRR